MRILVTATHVPFMSGGAEAHIQGVGQALQRAGHQVEVLRLPFRFSPAVDIHQAMEYAETLDFAAPNGLTIDKAVSLQFPGWGIQHPDHTVWVMHQHRAVYELWDEQRANAAEHRLRDAVIAYDNRHLAEAGRLFANSGRVAERLKHYNDLDAEPLYHPPPGAERFSAGEDWGYVFYPSRLEGLKRQDLLIEAACHLTTPVSILLGGEGGQRERFDRLIEKHQLGDRVRLLGRLSEAEKIACYSHALAVFFGPFDEDYGYITLEAMLSGKPVITCTDSGGPREFVEHDETGWVVEPDPRAIAEAIDSAWQNRARSRDMGLAGQAAYHQAGISWERVVERLIG